MSFNFSSLYIFILKIDRILLSSRIRRYDVRRCSRRNFNEATIEMLLVRTKYRESGISKYGWKQARTGALHLTKVGNVETSSHRGMAIARTQMEQMDLKQFERNEIKCFRRVARNKEIT